MPKWTCSKCRVTFLDLAAYIAHAQAEHPFEPLRFPNIPDRGGDNGPAQV